MLILTRKLGESIAIGDDIKISIVEMKGRQLRIGIQAPPHIPVHRYEVYQAIQEQNVKAAAPDIHLGDVWNQVSRK